VSSALSSAEFSSDLRGRGLKDAQEYGDQGHSSSRRTLSRPAAGRLGLMANEVCARERVRGCVECVVCVCVRERRMTIDMTRGSLILSFFIL